MTGNSNRLAFERIGIDEALRSLLHLVMVDRKATPIARSRIIAKMARWENDLRSIISGAERAQTILVAELEARLGLKLDGELFAVAMFQPSTRNLFLEMLTQFCSEGNAIDECEHIRTLSILSDLSKVLALVGDAALSMAVLHHLWQPVAREVGQLTQRRAALVSNEHLAQICDSWKLYEHRVHLDPETPTKSEIEHIKGSLLEAVLGIVYMEHGFDALAAVVGRFF